MDLKASAFGLEDTPFVHSGTSPWEQCWSGQFTPLSPERAVSQEKLEKMLPLAHLGTGDSSCVGHGMFSALMRLSVLCEVSFARCGHMRVCFIRGLAFHLKTQAHCPGEGMLWCHVGPGLWDSVAVEVWVVSILIFEKRKSTDSPINS